jgi:hypothetical protein
LSAGELTLVLTLARVIGSHSTELRGGRAKGSPRPWDWAQA